MNKFCITFAGAVGSSKSPIANYLSGKLNLPILNNDSIRTEVLEDFGEFNFEEYIKRRDERAESILTNGFSFIYDASIDREWPRLQKWLEDQNYTWFIISLDLSKELLLHLYTLKGYTESQKNLDQLLNDHENFLANYSSQVKVHITDLEFKDRLYLSLEATSEFIKEKLP